jgi:hypothetical protein
MDDGWYGFFHLTYAHIPSTTYNDVFLQRPQEEN